MMGEYATKAGKSFEALKQNPRQRVLMDASSRLDAGCVIECFFHRRPRRLPAPQHVCLLLERGPEGTPGFPAGHEAVLGELHRASQGERAGEAAVLRRGLLSQRDGS